MSIDDRLRSAFSDLQQRADRLMPPALEPRPTGRRSLVPLLATAAVVTAIVSAAWLGGGRGEVPPVDRPTTATTTATTTTSSTSQPTSASQAPEDALRDGVVPELAALPFDQRVRVIDPVSGDVSVSTDDGVWVVSRLAFEDFPNSACLGSGDTPMTRSCPDDGELLLLDPAEDRILRAFPLPAYPPQWLFVTEDTVYCGRQGDGGLPNSMLCRVDRESGELTVRVFEFEPGNYELAYDLLPGTWLADETSAGDLVAAGVFLSEMRLDGEQLLVGDSRSGEWAAVDPVTLAVEIPDLGFGGETWQRRERVPQNDIESIESTSVCGMSWSLGSFRPVSAEVASYVAEDGVTFTVLEADFEEETDAFQMRKYAFAACNERTSVFDATFPPLGVRWGDPAGGGTRGIAGNVGGRFVQVEINGICEPARCQAWRDALEDFVESRF
ncbi:MAG: hypothetical protein ACFCVC_13615 [Acidimicrobiia bacterium]